MAALLAASVALPWWGTTLMMTGAVVPVAVGCTWRRLAHQWLRPRLASSALAGFAGLALCLLAIATIEVSMLVLAAAVLAAGAAVVERARLRGTPVLAHGEARARAAFDGTVHALGASPQLPGTEREVAMWVARQGRRRWSSPERVELRDEHRKVWIEVGAARVSGVARRIPEPLTREATRVLDGADPSRAVRVWSFRDGDPLHVVGGLRLEHDPTAPSLRDPGRVSVFAGALVVGRGRLADARRRAHARLVMWSVLAVGAGALVVADGLDRL